MFGGAGQWSELISRVGLVLGGLLRVTRGWTLFCPAAGWLICEPRLSSGGSLSCLVSCPLWTWFKSVECGGRRGKALGKLFKGCRAGTSIQESFYSYSRRDLAEALLVLRERFPCPCCSVPFQFCFPCSQTQSMVS